MPFNGSGTFTLVAGNPVVTGTTISSTVQNNTTADFATGLTNCVTRDGQSAALANLPMGGYKHTGAVAASTTGEYLTYGQTSANLSSLTVGTFTTTGNVNVNGNVTIGDAPADTLTINPSAITWAGSPVTHSGTHNFTTLGNTPSFSAGATFGNVAQAGANVLDWYQEGTFTPVASGDTVAGTGTYLSQIGRYVRMGRLVFVNIEISWSSHTGTGNLRISGLPFPFGQSINTLSAAPSFAAGGGRDLWTPTILAGGSSFNIRGITQSTGAITTAISMAAAASQVWNINGFYEV